MEDGTTSPPLRVITSQTVWQVTADKRHTPTCEKPLALVACVAKVSLCDRNEAREPRAEIRPPNE